MAEMGEVYSAPPPPPPDQSKPLKAWRTLLNWVVFFFQILLHIIRGTPSLAQVLSNVGFRKNLLFSWGSANDLPSSAAEFKPLSSEVPMEERESEAFVSPHPSPSPFSRAVVCGDGMLEKLTVVLDLDETLVCAYETSSLPSIIRSQAIEAGLKCFELECFSAEREVDGKPKVNHVTVFERPGLHDFLLQLSEFANLILFTAGLEGYASPLIDKIDLKNQFSRRLYRPATTITEYREHVKDLSCISNSFCRIVLVDNNPFSFLLQPLNGIPCIPFHAGQPDDQLLGVLLPLLRHLSYQEDVRPALYERFHMPEWFEKHGIPMSQWITCECDSPLGG